MVFFFKKRSKLRILFIGRFHHLPPPLHSPQRPSSARRQKRRAVLIHGPDGLCKEASKHLNHTLEQETIFFFLRTDTFWFSVVRHPFEHFSSAFNQMTRYLKEDEMRREFWIKQMKRFNINVR